MLKISGLYVIKYPTGRFGFAGVVPAALAYEGTAEDMETAKQHGPGLARRIAEREGRTFRTLAWDTEGEARKAAEALGCTITD